MLSGVLSSLATLSSSPTEGPPPTAAWPVASLTCTCYGSHTHLSRPGGSNRGRLGESEPPSVTVRAVNGFPAQELIEASRDADLLVVGSRGGGGFARLMMGSVSDQAVRHAYCPVVVVPGQG